MWRSKFFFFLCSSRLVSMWHWLIWKWSGKGAKPIHMNSNKYTSTFDDRNGETYTLWAADTFFGDISGRLGKGDILGDAGHWANQPGNTKAYQAIASMMPITIDTN